MSSRPGRNDPCHCGSGRKYKHCHLRDDDATRSQATRDHPHAALDIARDWLQARHRKAYGRAYESLLDAVWPDHDEALHPEDLETGLQQAVIANLSEHLIAAGEIGSGDHWQSIADLLLGPGGPSLTPTHRDWLASLAREPLRLYRIVEVHEGFGCRLVDLTDGETHDDPSGDDRSVGVNVDDPQLAAEVEPGLLAGARLVQVADRVRTSGALLAFAPQAEADVCAVLADTLEACADDGASAQQTRVEIELTLLECWLWQFTVPLPMSTARRDPRNPDGRD
ncbi:MAG: YecA family protein [Lautropia sp.]